MKALLLVDIQNDFMPGGALPVPKGDEIIPVVNELLEMPFSMIVATKDWHPEDHGSFADVHGKVPGVHVDLSGVDQILWPRHCVQGTKGAEFYPGWDTGKIENIFFKGTDRNIDSYSTFFDNRHKKFTGLEHYLKEKGVSKLFVAGLATDYCVKFSVFDALALGFEVYVIKDACRGIDLVPGDVEKAFEEMRAAGAAIIRSNEVMNFLDSEMGEKA